MSRPTLRNTAKYTLAALGLTWLCYFVFSVGVGLANTRIILATASQTPGDCHGITIPASANILSHNVSPSPVILDGGATTRLQLPQADLQSFIAPLQITGTYPVSHGPNTGHPSWAITQYTCQSPAGDALMIYVGDPSLPTVDLQIYTDWN